MKVGLFASITKNEHIGAKGEHKWPKIKENNGWIIITKWNEKQHN